MFESLSLEIVAYIGFAKVKAWAVNNELHYSKDLMLDPSGCTDDSVSEMSPDEFLRRLDLLNISDWKKSYKPIKQMYIDGVFWNVTYDDSDHKKMKYKGENAYPGNWDEFLKLMKDAVGDFKLHELEW